MRAHTHARPWVSSSVIMHNEISAISPVKKKNLIVRPLGISVFFVMCFYLRL